MTLFLNTYMRNDENINVGFNKSAIQINETAELTAILPTEESGITVYFYEAYTPTVITSTPRQAFQIGETCELYAKLKDEDGSIIPNTRVYFFVREEEDYNDSL